MESKLQGKAAIWLRGQRSLGKTWETWDAMKKSLWAWFKLEVTEVAATHAVHNLRHKMFERADEFYFRCILGLQQKNHRISEDVTGMDGWKKQVQIDMYTFFDAGIHKHIMDATLSLSNPPTTAEACLLYTSPSPRDKRQSRMPSSA